MGKASVCRRVASIAVAAMATPIAKTRQRGEMLFDQTFPTRRSCTFLGAGATLHRL